MRMNTVAVELATIPPYWGHVPPLTGVTEDGTQKSFCPGAGKLRPGATSSPEARSGHFFFAAGFFAGFAAAFFTVFFAVFLDCDMLALGLLRERSYQRTQ